MLPRFVEVTRSFAKIVYFRICGRTCLFKLSLPFMFFFQVRSLRAPYPLIQTVVLRNVRRLIQSNNAVIVALENSVYGLFPVPLGAQVFLISFNINAMDP